MTWYIEIEKQYKALEKECLLHTLLKGCEETSSKEECKKYIEFIKKNYPCSR